MEYSKKYYQENKEYFKEYNKKYRLNNIDKIKKYRLKHYVCSSCSKHMLNHNKYYHNKKLCLYIEQ